MKSFVRKRFMCAAILYAVHHKLSGCAALLGAQSWGTTSRPVKYGSSELNKCARNVRMGTT